MTETARQSLENTAKYRRDWPALLRATHEFASLERPTRQEISKFKELFYTLCLKSTDPEIRIISNTLAFNPYVPRSIVYVLSLCKTDIAEQMILFSPVLKPRDLVAIIQKAGAEHAALVARRSDVTEEVAESILGMDANSGRLREILSENVALLSNQKIQRLLSGEQEIEPEKEVIDPSLAEATKLETVSPPKIRDMGDELVSLAAKGGKLGRETMEKPASQTPAPERDGPKLLHYARGGQKEAFAWRVERRCKLPAKYTLELIANRDAGGIATILRSLEVPKTESGRILLLMAPELGRNARVFNQVVAMYEKLSLEECRAYLKRFGADFVKGWDMTTDRMRMIRKEALRTRETELPLTIPERGTIVGKPQLEAAS